MSTAKTRVDIELVRELASILTEAGLGELEVEHEGMRVRVSRPQAEMRPIEAVAAPAPTSPSPATGAPRQSVESGGAEPVAIDENAVTSPMVGTVYLSPEPGSKVFVNEGDKVAKGETLMLVEAMKTFNPVESPRAGIVRKILVTDSQPVEYGAPLMIVS